MPDPVPVRRGRYAEAQRNDVAILDAAREVFVADPSAPMSAVAHRAGVGIGALYHRYASKDELLATLCEEGQDRYLDALKDALAEKDSGRAYRDFLCRIVAADTHSMVVRLAGRFPPTPSQLAKAEQMRRLNQKLFRRAQADGAVRADATFADQALLLEAIAKTDLGDRERTAELRQRQLAIVLDGLTARDRPALPGTPPSWDELTSRWG